MPRYVIIGAGAVGATLAAQLHDASIDHVLVGRGPGIATIAANGLTYIKNGTARSVPVAASDGPEATPLHDGDVLVFATKTQDLEEAARQWAWQPVRFAERTGVAAELPVITLQNGLAADRILQRRFGAVIGGTILTPAHHVEPGHVRSGASDAVGIITIGGVSGVADTLVHAVAADLRSAGYLVQVTADVARWQRAKLLGSVRNGLEVLAGDPEQLARVADLLVDETTAVLAAAGASVADTDAERTIDTGAFRRDPDSGLPPGQQSTWQSFHRGVSTEVDYLNGEVSLLGRILGVATPYNAALQTVLGVASAGHERPGSRDIAEVIALAHRYGEQADSAAFASPPAATRRWNEPAGIQPRGTVIVLAGRGEAADVYHRFGSRIAADGYRVIALADDAAAHDGGATPREATATTLLADPETVSPVVVIGTDTGALAARRFADAHPTSVAAVVLAGAATEHTAALDHGTELTARTACPNHQRVLTTAARTGLFSPAAIAIDIAPAEHSDIPVLAIHGGDDALSPLAAAIEQYARLGAGDVHVVSGGRHDILNDITHRTVAATITTFLERLRLGRELPVIVTTVPADLPAAALV